MYHDAVRAYMDRGHYVTDKKQTKDLQIKDAFLLCILNSTLNEYRISIIDLGPKRVFFHLVPMLPLEKKP